MLELQVDDDVHSLGIMRLAATGQDVEDDLVADSTGAECLAHCGLDSLQAIFGDSGEDAYKAPVGIVALAQLTPQLGQCRWESPVLEGSTIAQRTGLAGEDGQGDCQDFRVWAGG